MVFLWTSTWTWRNDPPEYLTDYCLSCQRQSGEVHIRHGSTPHGKGDNTNLPHHHHLDHHLRSLPSRPPSPSTTLSRCTVHPNINSGSGQRQRATSLQYS